MPDNITPQKASNKGRTLFNDALLISSFPAAIYFLAFSYESGYFLQFDVPLTLIQIQINTILRVVLNMLLVIFVMFLVFNFSYRHLPEEPLLRAKFMRTSGWLILLVAVYVMYSPSYEADLLLTIGLIFVFVYEILWPLYFYRKIEGFLNKCIADEAKGASVADGRGSSIVESIEVKYGGRYIFIFMTLLFLHFFIKSAGLAKASTQEEYFVFSAHHQEFAAIRIYSDIVIGVGFDRTTKELKSDIVVVEISDVLNSKFKLETVGPFVAKQQESAKGLSFLEKTKVLLNL
jgi:hypothetical protein